MRMYDVCGVDGIAPARGLLKNPSLLRQIEAACAGTPDAFGKSLSEEDFLALLGAQSPRKKRIFVLKVAKVMYGEDSEAFRKMVGAQSHDNQEEP